MFLIIPNADVFCGNITFILAFKTNLEYGAHHKAVNDIFSIYQTLLLSRGKSP